MRKLHRLLICILLTAILLTSGAAAYSGKDGNLGLNDAEKEWLQANRHRTFVLGLDPYAGMEYFTYNGEVKGYLIPLAKEMEKDLGIKIQLEGSKSWGEVYKGLQSGTVDILFGANVTPERLKIMAFTRPVYKTPYAIIALKNGSIHTIGDIDNKRVGFLENDFVIDLLPETYKNIKYTQKIYNTQDEGAKALINHEIDAFITSGGPAAFDYIYQHPELTYAFKLSNITSDMTFSTRIGEKILADILDKEIQYLERNNLNDIINQGEAEYNIKIMSLSPQELSWLKEKGTAVVGITKDYLPFDYYIDNEYKGISGEIIKEIGRKTGIRFTYYYSDFDTLSEMLKNGQIDMLNIAKTDDRMQFILYPRPYSTERDIIIGRNDSPDARDIFGLEGKRIAVIKGFWHYEHLKKNLAHVEIVETNNIQESLKLVNEGKADYLIENPTVARYYIEDLQLYNLVEKGTTSTDSYLYYGINKQKPELAGIVNKVIPLMDMTELFKTGYSEVPHEDRAAYTKNLVFAVFGLGAILVLVVLYVIKLIKDLIKEKTETELLRQREEFLNMDSLTGLHNRNYYNSRVKDTLEGKPFPQTVVIADMNNLKTINDQYGHHVGDDLLKHFAMILKEKIPTDLIFRIGGDEFLIIFTGVDESKVEILLNEAKEEISKRSMLIDESIAVYAEAAFGYASRHFSEESLSELIKIADQRMYLDKNTKKTI